MPKTTKILIIEDEPDARLLLSRRLQAGQFEVLEAEDGPSGIAQAKQGMPDLIVLDLMLPGQDGFETYQILRKDPLTQPIPILFLTAVSSGTPITKESLDLIAEAKHGIHLEGNYAAMEKPYNPAHLLETIQALLGKQKGRTQ